MLHRAIRELRRVLGDDAARPICIETIRKRGYRVIAAVVPAIETATVSRDRPARAVRSEIRPAPIAAGAPASALMWICSAILAVIVFAAVGTLAGLSSGPVPEAEVRFVPLVSGPLNEGDPAMAADGRLAYVMRPRPGSGGQSDIYVLDEPGGEPLRVTDHPADDHLPVWSPDAHALGFVRASSSSCDVVIRTLASGAERIVGPCGNPFEPRVGSCVNLSWPGIAVAPDGRGVLYARWDRRESNIMSLETGTRPPAGSR